MAAFPAGAFKKREQLEVPRIQVLTTAPPPPPGKYGLRTQFKEWEQLDIEEKPTLTGLSFQVRRTLMSPDEP